MNRRGKATFAALSTRLWPRDVIGRARALAVAQGGEQSFVAVAKGLQPEPQSWSARPRALCCLTVGIRRKTRARGT